MPTTWWPVARSRSTRWEPMKPAAPVTTTFKGRSSLRGDVSSQAVSRFEAWLEDSGSGIAVRQFPQGTRTATDAARAVGCELGQIVKSLVFMAGASPVIALMSGPNRLDEARLAALVGEPVSKADPETARVAT